MTEGPSIPVPQSGCQPQTRLPPPAKPEPREQEGHSQMGGVQVSLAGLLGHPYGLLDQHDAVATASRPGQGNWAGRAVVAAALSWQERVTGKAVPEKGQRDSQRGLRQGVSFEQGDRLKHRGGDAVNAACSPAQRAVITPKKDTMQGVQCSCSSASKVS